MLKHSNTIGSPQASAKLASRESKPKLSKTIMETHTIEELTFERFLFSDMSKFSAEIKKTETKVFSPKEYFVEITISHIPTFIIPKTLAEFKAFYKALKLRFSNIQWPDFPGAFSVFKRKFQKKQVLNRILQNICEVAKLRDKDKKALLGIFYAFFLDSQAITKMKRMSTVAQPSAQPTDPKKSIASTTVSENDNETDFQRIEEIQKDIEDRLQNIIHKESHDDSSFREGDWSLPLVDSPTLVSRKDVLHNPKHTNSLPGAFMLEENSYKSENSQLDAGRSDKKSFDALESIASPRLDSSHSDPKHGSHPEQEGEKSQSFDRDDICEDLGLHVDGPGGHRNGANRPRSIFKRAKGNSVNGPGAKATTFSDNVVISDEEKEKPAEPLDKAKEKERKKEEKRRKKEEKKKGIEEAAMSRRRARGPSAGAKEIPNFSGIIYMRLSSETKWNKYFARLSGSCIVLYRSILESSPVHFIPCFRCELKYIYARGGDYLEFWHANDEDRFQITLIGEDEEEEEIESSDLNGDLCMWYEQIRIVSEKLNGLNLTSTNYSPIGKLQVVVYGAFDVRGLPNNSSCYVRLNHVPYSLSTSKTLRNDIMKWKQSFFIPLCDTFFPISVELVCVYNDGWITENLKEEVICTGEILIADIISLKSTNILTINLPMKYTDAKVKSLTKQLGIAEKDLSHPKIEVRLKNLSSLKSYFAPPYADYIEGVKMDSDTFSKQLMKLGISRLKRIFTYIGIKMAELEFIFNFKYPLFSYICFILFIYWIIIFDVSSLAQDLILMIVIICVYKNPKIEKMVLKRLDKLFFQPQHINPFYTEPRIQTLEELDQKKLMGTEKWKYKLVDPDSLVTVFRKAKKSIITITIFLTKLTGFIEKFKNIITWKDPTRTVVFVIFSLLAYCFISVMSFRIIVLLGVIAKFIQGIKYYENLNKRNQEAARLALQFVIKECYPDQYNAIFNDTNTPWPTMSNFNVFQSKIVERMNDRLKINLSDDALRIARTPLDFILMLATSSIPLKVKMSPVEENSLLHLKKKSPQFGLINVMYFIMNVPSDYYRVIHPKVIDIAECIQE